MDGRQEEIEEEDRQRKRRQKEVKKEERSNEEDVKAVVAEVKGRGGGRKEVETKKKRGRGNSVWDRSEVRRLPSCHGQMACEGNAQTLKNIADTFVHSPSSHSRVVAFRLL